LSAALSPSLNDILITVIPFFRENHHPESLPLLKS
jgi:hypothetical protein